MEPGNGRQGTLSRREKEIAALVAEGLTNRAIAARMFLSERTVDSHLEHIREKLGVSSRAQVATWFVAQPQPSAAAELASIAAAPAARRWGPNRTLAVAAVAVVVLAASAFVYERLSPAAPTGPAITTFTSVDPGDKLWNPGSVAVGADGSVYIADNGHLSIRKVDPKAGSISTFAGGNPLEEFVDGSDRLKASLGAVTSVAFAPNGRTLFFTSNLTGQAPGPAMVGRIDPDGTVHYVAGARTASDGTSPIQLAIGLVFAPDGTLYIADRGNRVWKRTPDGVLTLFAGNGQEGFGGDGGAATEAKLDRPRALAVEPDGDVLIADTDNNRIREVIHGSNEIVTIAGTGDYYGFSGDGGPATQAKLSLPWGVAVGPDGTIYIADAGNDRVRSVDKKGVMATLIHGNLNAPTGVAVSATGDLYVVALGDPWLRLIHVARRAST
ncbi:MAG TPA: LuxR C-terminal-related transcriptional regulator [Candidatus Dormibacteraeota bacterium]|nr:LuxR C-terminal-related transcriptional regulator [Candidatus Dormibacteraeota bacterium]